MRITCFRHRRTSLLRLFIILFFIASGLSVNLNPTSSPRTYGMHSLQQDLPWQNKESPFGVVAALGNRVREDEIHSAVALMREAGVQWQREEIFWSRVQKEPGGPFNWSGDENGMYNYDRAIGAQVEAGINILGLLDYNPYWFQGDNPPPEAWIEDWGNFVYAAVSHYGRDLGWIKHWELWNEPNLEPFGYSNGLYEIKDFVRILEVGNAAAKAADPEAVIVMGGMSGVQGSNSPFTYDQFEYMDRVGQLGGWNYVDVLAVHPYHGIAPEAQITRFDRVVTLQQELEYLDKLLHRYGPKPLWITELGWSSRSGGAVSEDAQAFYLIRAYVISLAHPSVEKFFWYDFRNDTYPDAPYEAPIYNERETEFHFGLLRRAFPLDPDAPALRKPVFLAFRTMTHLLNGLYIQPGNLGRGVPGLYHYQFLGGDRRVDVLWNTGEGGSDASEETTVFVECDCDEAVVRNWNGALNRIIYASNGSLTLRPEANGAPIFVEYGTNVDMAPANSDALYFETTSHTLQGAFRAYWENNGGLSRFGYPVTEELIEPDAGSGHARVVQYFERTRFEYFPELADTPFTVQTGRLGVILLEQHGVDWLSLPRVTEAPEECILFEDTGHSLCPPFREAWEQNGGLELIGYPLTEPFEAEHPETETTYTVQYFERARMERFPEHEGTPNEVQFGSLVRELFTSFGGMP